MTNDPGEWRVAHNHESCGVEIEFNEVGEDGVTSFQTAMSPHCAIDFALNLIENATCVLVEEHP